MWRPLPERRAVEFDDVGGERGLPLEAYRALRPRELRAVVSLKLALVGLRAVKICIPSNSAAACASARRWPGPWRSTRTFCSSMSRRQGLDPLSSRRLDDLILELRASLGATIVVVTHELASILTIGDNSIFLDAETRTMLAVGHPKTLRDASPEPKIRAFLSRGEADATTA